MSHRKYYVTYAVMDAEAGANPFWHACLILSQQDDKNKPIKVVDSIGFYSQPTTSTNPVIKTLKRWLGFSIDLQNSHGILLKEKMRDLDGNGLHGLSFEISENQFFELQDSYKKQMEQEEQAISELTTSLQKAGMPANGHTRYLQELADAKIAQREPRLKKFHVTMPLTIKGPDSRDSYTCKNYALDLLLDCNIIDKETKEKILGNKMQFAFPRFSGESFFPVRLVSTGAPTETHSKRTGKVFFNREWPLAGANTAPMNELFWVYPPTQMGNNIVKSERAKINTAHRKLRAILDRIRNIETKLRLQIIKLSKSPQSRAQAELLNTHLQRVEALYDNFMNAHENKLPEVLKNRTERCTTTLDIAEISLRPEVINYSFMLRAYHSISMRHAAIGALSLVAGVLLLTNPAGWALGIGGIIAGSALTSAGAIYTSGRTFGFWQEEKAYARKVTHYKQAYDIPNTDEATLIPSAAILPSLQ